MPRAVVVSVGRDPHHAFSKPAEACIELLQGLGVRGDAHMGATVKHRSRVAKNASQPNLRQVHLIHEELLVFLRGAGFAVWPGAMGENITTSGIDLLSLPAGTRLTLGGDAVVELTGLRLPCKQIDRFQAGLMQAVSTRNAAGVRIHNPGVMAIVVANGLVRPGDAIEVTTPPLPHEPLHDV
jgi:MOSC domain-containing protein YiiM